MPQAEDAPSFAALYAASSTGRASREMVGASATDLVVLDAMLADVDGLEVARRLRQEGFETPILFLAADYATKPLLGRDRRVKRTPFCGAASLRALGLSLSLIRSYQPKLVAAENADALFGDHATGGSNERVPCVANTSVPTCRW